MVLTRSRKARRKSADFRAIMVSGIWQEELDTVVEMLLVDELSSEKHSVYIE